MTQSNKPHHEMDEWLKKYRRAEVLLTTIQRICDMQWPDEYRLKISEDLIKAQNKIKREELN